MFYTRTLLHDEFHDERCCWPLNSFIVAKRLRVKAKIENEKRKKMKLRERQEIGKYSGAYNSLGAIQQLTLAEITRRTLDSPASFRHEID